MQNWARVTIYLLLWFSVVYKIATLPLFHAQVLPASTQLVWIVNQSSQT